MKNLPAWWPIVAALVGAGMWLGALQQRVANLEQTTHYYHGDLQKEK